MSRCFPFPPTGYERKHVPEDLDLLTEAKRKEKRHKKEKKHKERKKDKEKKEKDGSDEKHRDKKDEKAKHKEKEKHSKDRISSLNEGKCSLSQGQDGWKPSQSSLPSQVNEEPKFVQQLDRRIRGDEKGVGSQLPKKVAVVDKKDQEMVARAGVRISSGLPVEEKADNKNKGIERKIYPRGPRNEFSGNTMVRNLMPMTKSKVEGIPKPVDENGWRLEDKEKYKETGGVKWGDKAKDRDKEGQGKEKHNEKEKKKDEAKGKTENKPSSQNHLKDDGRNNLGGFTGNKITNLSKDINSNAANEGSIRKRKDMSTNGFLHESEIRPNKMQRPASHQLTENGRKLEPFQTPTKSPHDKHAVTNSVRVDSKDRLMNGIIEAQKPSPLKPKPSAATMVSDQIADTSKIPHPDSHYMNKVLKVPKVEDLIAEASRRPPHPDSKYQDEVLTVPKIEDWSENDDQDWWFHKKGPSTKPNVELVGVKEDLQVWSAAVHINSADVFALPYVIPY